MQEYALKYKGKKKDNIKNKKREKCVVICDSTLLSVRDITPPIKL